MKSSLRYRLVILGWLFAQTNILYAQDSIQTLSLDDCIRIGLQQSTQLLLSQDSLKITGAALIGAYGNFLPNLALNGNYAYTSGKSLLTVTTPTLVQSRGSQLDYNLTTTINIFNGLSDYSALKAATLNKSASEFNLQRSKQQIAFDVTQTFLQVILDRQIVQYAGQNLDASNKREEQLRELTAVGRNAISDLYQQQAETSSDKLFLIQSQDKLKNDIILLLRKIKISETDKYDIADMPPDTLPLGPDYQNAQDLIAKAVQQRPDLRSSELSIKVADWQIRQYRSGYLPKLNFGGGLYSTGGYLNELYLNGVDEIGPLELQEPPARALFGQFYGEVGLNLTWNIFDRLYTKTNVDIARIYRQNAQILNTDLNVQIGAEIRSQAYNDYLAALQQIETANTGLFCRYQGLRGGAGQVFCGPNHLCGCFQFANSTVASGNQQGAGGLQFNLAKEGSLLLYRAIISYSTL